MSSSEKPLITFALRGYKQEQFIREAVQGAFAQTYSPLEIILSDDCSPDRTFAIMQEMAADYQGPHKIVLNRNPTNFGTSGHVNALMKIAQGELIVCADGDDVSVPERTAALTSEWLRAGKPSGICSEVIYIDTNGNPINVSDTGVLSRLAIFLEPRSDLPLRYIQRNRCVTGCSAAWAKDNWEVFGPLLTNNYADDAALTFRAALRGGIAAVPNRLVRYRMHDANISMLFNQKSYTPEFYMNMERNMVKIAAGLVFLRQNQIDDTRKAASLGIISPGMTKKLLRRLLRSQHKDRMRADWWNSSFFLKMRNFLFLKGPLYVRFMLLLPFESYGRCRCLLGRLHAGLHFKN